MKRIYVAGPMTGYPDLNFPLFHSVAAELRSRGLDVVNPAELNSDPSKSWHACMRVDIRELVTCDIIVMLPGWEQSKGATLERHIAKALELQVEYL
jgi:nucleoside 2-deoxyribosyltransferase